VEDERTTTAGFAGTELELRWFVGESNAESGAKIVDGGGSAPLDKKYGHNERSSGRDDTPVVDGAI